MCSFSNYLVEVCKEKAIVAFARASLHYAHVSGLVRAGLDHVRWSKLTQVEIDRSNAHGATPSTNTKKRSRFLKYNLLNNLLKKTDVKAILIVKGVAIPLHTML